MNHHLISRLPDSAEMKNHSEVFQIKIHFWLTADVNDNIQQAGQGSMALTGIFTLILFDKNVCYAEFEWNII